MSISKSGSIRYVAISLAEGLPGPLLKENLPCPLLTEYFPGPSLAENIPRPLYAEDVTEPEYPVKVAATGLNMFGIKAAGNVQKSEHYNSR